MRAMALPVVVLVLVLFYSEPVSSIMAAHCEKMGQKAQEDLCTFESNLTNLQFPNFLGHENQEDAYTALKGYEVLLASQSKCSDSLAIFLCHTYMPVCYPEDETVIIKPCRAECEMSRYNCSSLMVHYSYPWPDDLNCDNFPWADEVETWCIGDPVWTKKHFLKTFPEVLNASNSHYTPVKPDSLTKPDPERYAAKFGNCPRIGLANVDHSFNEYNCGLPCNSPYYGPKSNTTLLKYWVLVWASLCCLATLFVIMTFLFDQQRFRYPERAIIFGALCYLFISGGFILGFGFNEDIVCANSKDQAKTNANVSVIRQGDDHAPLCFIQLFLVYYFLLASFLWWVILNLTWFLAAGLKWGHEAIALKAKYFHLVAWVVPAVLFTIICSTKAIDGDFQANICFVGSFDNSALQFYVIGPLILFYVIGMTFLGLGMVSMCSVRHELHTTGKKTDKLETLMIRIGMFSVLYSIPATILISCFLYERFQRSKWEVGYVSYCLSERPGACDADKYSGDFVADPTQLTFNLIKYLMMLVTGLSTGFWVLLSFKTVSNWVKLLKCRSKTSETAV